MKVRYTDFNGCHYFVLEDGTRVSFPDKTTSFVVVGMIEGDFRPFSKSQKVKYYELLKTLGRPDAFEPCYVDIPEELLK